MPHSLDASSLIFYDDTKLDHPVGYVDGGTGREIMFEKFKGKLIMKYFPSQDPVWTDMGYIFIYDLDNSSGKCNMVFSYEGDDFRSITLNWTNLRRMRIMPVPVE